MGVAGPQILNLSVSNKTSIGCHGEKNLFLSSSTLLRDDHRTAITKNKYKTTNVTGKNIISTTHIICCRMDNDVTSKNKISISGN